GGRKPAARHGTAGRRPETGATALPRPRPGHPPTRQLATTLAGDRAYAPAGVDRNHPRHRHGLAAAGGRPAAANPTGGLPVNLPTHMRGAALVLVLWLVALLAASIGAFALSARVEYMQGRVAADLGAGQQIAQAGIDYALSRMRPIPTQPAWHADGRPYRWQFDGRSVELRIV